MSDKKNMSVEAFIAGVKAAARAGKTQDQAASELGMTKGNMNARIKRLNEGFKAANQPELPKFKRASGTRTQNWAALAQIGEEVAETVETTEGAETAEVAEGAEVAQTTETETVTA